MRSIDDLYNFYQFILRKERGVFITTARFAANLDIGQMDAFEEWFKPYGVNQQVHDALTPFKVYQPFTSDTSGIVAFNDDYMHLLGQPFTVTGSTVNPVDFVNEDELPFALTSQLRPVTNTTPIAIDVGKSLTIYPQFQQTGAYFYLRRPVAPVYGVTQVGRVVTYDPLTSVQLEWVEIYWDNILAKALRYAGVYMDEKGIYAYADQYNSETKP